MTPTLRALAGYFANVSGLRMLVDPEENIVDLKFSGKRVVLKKDDASPSNEGLVAELSDTQDPQAFSLRKQWNGKEILAGGAAENIRDYVRVALGIHQEPQAYAAEEKLSLPFVA